MYVPKAFALTDAGALRSFIEAHPFGILVSARDGIPLGTHVPFVLLEREPLTLGLHMAKANPHWEALQSVPVLAIFHGPHEFISASWYEDPRVSVPTWNYSAVHCAGIAGIADERETQRILEMMVDTFEGERGWSIEGADRDYVDRMKRGIVGIRVAVTSIQGVVKHSQNRSDEDRRRVAARLEQTCPEIAEEMRAQLR